MRRILCLILAIVLLITSMPLAFSDGESFDPMAMPTVTTENATGIGGYNATLQGNLTDDGGEGCVTGFEYGLDTSYGNNATALPTYLYFGGATNLTIWKVWQSNMTKKANTTSFGGQIYALAEDDTYVYAGGATNLTVKQYYKSNMTLKANTVSYGGTIYTLAQDDTYVYAGGVATPSNKSNVTQYWKSNMTMKANTTTPYGGDIRAIAQDSEYIYVTGSMTVKVHQYWKSNMTKKAETPSLLPGAVVYALAVDDNYIYAGGETNSVSQFWKSNMTWKANASIGYGDIVRVIAIDDTYIYVGGASQMTVKQYWKSNMTYKAQTPSYGWSTTAIAVDSTYLYVGETTANSVRQYYKYNLALKTNTTSYGGTINAISSLTDKYATGGTFSFNSTGLTPLTTYHYRAYAINSAGKSVGDDKTFTTLVGAPTVTTNDATGIATTNTTLQGILTNDGGEPCTVRFEYGLNTTYGTNSTNQTASMGDVFSFNATELLPLTLYHYRAYANNSVGESVGADKQFATFGTAPNVTTNDATGVSFTNVTLQGTLTDDGGDDCNIGFEYGLDTSYGTNVTPLPTYIYAGGATTQKVFQYLQSNMTKNAESLNYSGIVYALAEDADYIYAGGATNLTVWQIWKSNMTKKTNTSSYGGIIYAIAQDSNYIYVGGATNQTVKQYWKSNMTLKANTSSYGGDIRAIVQDSNYIYVGGGTNFSVKQYYKADMTLKANTLSYGGIIYALAQDENYIYAGGATNLTVWQIWKSNMTKNANTSSYGGTINALAVDDTYIYAGGATTQTVRKYWKSNMTFTNNQTANFGGVIQAIARDSNYIYVGGATNFSVKQYFNSNLTLTSYTASYGGVIWTLSSFVAYRTGAFSLNLTGIQTGTLYHYRAYAKNSIGLVTGSDKSFTTLGPSVTTNNATGISPVNATLQGTLTNDGGEPCTVRFEYGLNTSYGTNSTNQTKSAGETFFFNATGLLIGRLYHYRAYANNSATETTGSDKTFITLTPDAVYVDDNAEPSWYDFSHVRTINEAVVNCSTVGIIYVLSGTYPEVINITNKNITIIGNSTDLPVINPRLSNTTIQNIFLFNGSGYSLSLQYLNISNYWGCAPTPVHLGISVPAQSNLTVDHCIIHDINQSIKCYGNVTFTNNTAYRFAYRVLEGSWSGATYALQFICKYNVIYDSTLTSGGNNEVIKPKYGHWYGDISYNYIAGCRVGIWIDPEGGPVCKFGGNWTISHNTIDSRYDPAIRDNISQGITFTSINGGFDKIDCRDNIVNGANYYSIYHGGASIGEPFNTSTIVKNCILYNSFWLYFPTSQQRFQWNGTGYSEYINYTINDTIPVAGWVNSTVSGYLFDFQNCSVTDPMFNYEGAPGPEYWGLRYGSPAVGTASDGTNIGAWQGTPMGISVWGASPRNNSLNVRTDKTLSCNLNASGSMNWTIQSSPDVGSGSGTGVTNTTISVNTLGLQDQTSYIWFVNVTDGDILVNKTYYFTTGTYDVYVDDDASPEWYDFKHVRTIQNGVNNCSDGGIIHVYSGMYPEQITIPQKNVSIIGNSTNMPVINPQLSNATYQKILSINGSGGRSLTLQYLNISNYWGGNTTQVHYGVWLTTVNNLIVDHCIIHDISVGTLACGNTTFTNNTVYNFKYHAIVGDGPWSGSVTYPLQFICKYNVIYDSVATEIGNSECIRAINPFWYGDISYNYVAGCKFGIWVDPEPGVFCIYGGNWTVAHNTVDSRYNPANPGNLSEGIAFTSSNGNFDKMDCRDNIVNGANYYSISHGGFASGEPFNSSIIVKNCVLGNSYWLYFPTLQRRFQWNGTGYSDGVNYTANDTIPVAGWYNTTVSGYLFDFQNCSVADPLFNNTGAPGPEYWGLRYGSPAVGTASDGTNIGAWQGIPAVPPPILSNENPTNNSIAQPRSLTWNITIEVPVGDTFNWTIQCNNGQSNSANDDTNGTKSLEISGLSYLTPYTVWVNATDINGWTREWFTFTTEGNAPPFISNENPTNNSISQPLALTWNCTITDPVELMDWSIECSNGQTSNGTSETGNIHLFLSGLSYSTEYFIWVNVTDGIDWTREWFTFTTLTNTAPSYGTPSPTNGSSDNPLSLTWSIPISDANGDLFDWTIECSNSQQNSATGASNGSKTVSLSGLAYSTPYTVWVNTTDGTDWTRDWFTFTTEDNLPPTFGTPSPENGSINQSLALTWEIPINDPEGNLINWGMECDGQYSGGIGEGNGTKQLSLSGLTYSTIYTVWVNATDGTEWTREWFSFTTEGNAPPFISNENPTNNSISQPLALTWNCTITDPVELMDWSIECSNGQTSNGTSETGNIHLFLSGLSYSTEYFIWVNVTDGIDWTRQWYTFTTLSDTAPNYGTPDPTNGSIGNTLALTWSIPISDEDGDLMNWTIQCSNGQQNSASDATNGTKQVLLSGLAYSGTYTVWVNTTDGHEWTRQWFTFTTEDNLPPTFGTPSPENGSINQSLALTWEIPINDPEGDPFDYTIRCSNGQSTGLVTGETNGTKSFSITSLYYSVTYTVYVNATDPSGSGILSEAFYEFTTMDNTPPDQPWNETILNGSAWMSVYNENLTVTVSDPDNNSLTVEYYWGNGTLIGTIYNVTSGTNALLYLPNYTTPSWLQHETNYTWYVKVFDSVSNITGPLWWFTTSKAWDINEDRIADYQDASIFVSHFSEEGYLPGESPSDINEDGIIDYIDASIFVRHFSETY